MEYLFGLSLVILGIVVIAVFLACMLMGAKSSDNNSSWQDTKHATQNLNINGHVRHTHKDINSY